MKTGSGNYLLSSMLGIMKRIKENGIGVVLYESVLEGQAFFRSRIVSSLQDFKKITDVMVAKRVDKDLKDVVVKVYTRDLFGSD